MGSSSLEGPFSPYRVLDLTNADCLCGTAADDLSAHPALAAGPTALVRVLLGSQVLG